MCTIFLQILKIVCALFARGGWPLFILLPRRLVFSETHRGREGTKKGRGVISPGPRLFLLASVLRARSFLALLLFASQELVRDSAYRIRHSAYRIRHSAYRIRYLRSCSRSVLVRPREVEDDARLVPNDPSIVSRRDHHGIVGA